MAEKAPAQEVDGIGVPASGHGGWGGEVEVLDSQRSRLRLDDPSFQIQPLQKPPHPRGEGRCDHAGVGGESV